jgi:hypothetical protein
MLKHTLKLTALGLTDSLIVFAFGLGLTVAHRDLRQLRSQPLSAQLELPAVVSRPSPQEVPNRSDRILNGAVAELLTAEPSWRFIGGICSCPRLIDEEESVTVGTFKREVRGEMREVAALAVYQISTVNAASLWIEAYGKGHVASGWTVTPYNLGVPSFLSTFRDHTRYTITFAKGRSLVIVSGASMRDIDQVARCLLRQTEKQVARCATAAEQALGADSPVSSPYS